MTFAHPPDQPCDATCDHPRSGDATEALARCVKCGHSTGFHGASFCVYEAGGTKRRACDCSGWRRPIHSVTAEAADREADPEQVRQTWERLAEIGRNAGSYPSAAADPRTVGPYSVNEQFRRGVGLPSAAADPDVEALAAAYVDYGTLTVDEFTEKYPASLTGRFWTDLAAYAAAKRDPSAPADPTGGGIVTPRTKAGRALANTLPMTTANVLAIEREAAARERERIRTLDDGRLGLTDTQRLTALLIDLDTIVAEPSE